MKTRPTRDHYLYYNASLKFKARELRNFPTKYERLLWEIVRRKRLYGFAFTRQRPALDFIVDLMCKDLLLILEADGEVHELDDQKLRDEKRTLALEQAGFTILRFSNWEIKNRPDFVEAEIRAWIRQKTGIEDPAREIDGV